MRFSRRWSSRAGKLSLILIIAVLLMGSAPPVFAQTPIASPEASPTATGPWKELAPIPVARSEFAAATIGTDIYVAGGFESDGRLTRFDTLTGQWSELAPLPEGVHHPGVAALDGKIYVAGGHLLDGHTSVDNVWAYDVATNTWTERKHLPIARGALGLVAVDGLLYAIGGAELHLGGPATGVVDIYDPATDSWSPGVELPTAREHLAVVALNGKIYAIGGRANGNEDDQYASANEVYDPATRTWTKLAPLPVPRGGLTGLAINNRIVVSGGERGDHAFADVNEYDPATDSWTALPSLPTARHGAASAAVGSTIYVIAGSTVARTVVNTSVVEALTLDESGAPID